MMTNQAHTFPFLEINGTHRDIGAAIGESFRTKIQETISWRKSVIPDYKALRQQSQRYFLPTLHKFPELIEELTAIAIAADVGVMDLFFANTRSLFDSTPDPEEEKIVSHDRCTTVVSFNSDGPVVGHNEDWEASQIDELYILKATIGDTTFFGVHYATELPGTAAAMNNKGMVFGLNELHQIDILGIPKNFLARAVLETTSLDEAEQLLTTSEQDSGFNHVLVQGNEVRDAEIAGGEIEIITAVNQPFVHTNHFLGKLKKYEVYQMKNSVPRYERAKELVHLGMQPQDMMKLLSDHANLQYPICRHNETLASLVFVPNRQEVYICWGPPCQGTYVKYTV